MRALQRVVLKPLHVRFSHAGHVDGVVEQPGIEPCSSRTTFLHKERLCPTKPPRPRQHTNALCFARGWPRHPHPHPHPPTHTHTYLARCRGLRLWRGSWSAALANRHRRQDISHRDATAGRSTATVGGTPSTAFVRIRVAPLLWCEPCGRGRHLQNRMGQ